MSATFRSFQSLSPFVLRRTVPRALTISACTGLSIYTAHRVTFGTPQSLLLRCDSAPGSFSTYRTDAKTPIVKQGGGLNPRAIRQVTTGSIIGLIGGLAVGLFSKPLTILLGLCFVGVQYLESKTSISLIPYGRLQKYFTNIDLKSAVKDNLALKISFGLAFAMAGFAEF